MLSTQQSAIARIVLTPGEPASIGPDLVIALVQQPLPLEVVVVASKALLQARARILDLPLLIKDYDPNLSPAKQAASTLVVIDEPLAVASQPGQLDERNVPYVINTLKRAAQGCLQQEFAAMVTGPVHKGIINRAGIEFHGHTDFLADFCHVDRVVMMLANPALRVALVTTHIPLRLVPEHIQANDLTRVIEIIQTAMQTHFNIAHPCIYVAGLNPHAGEQGILGDEEIEIIEPVINHLNQRGFNLIGPLAADTLFVRENLAAADVVLAMYHDQGLPVLKSLGFNETVNITLGLPFIRTSVGHGTALEMAGTGKASVNSLRLALRQAMSFV